MKLKEELGGYHAEGGAGWMVWVLEYKGSYPDCSGQERRRFMIVHACARVCMFYEGKEVWAKPSSFSSS